ncbi:MAG: methyl-accepting chemotaxis protein [Rouxiella aceris]|uniref:methyl-accepting chemotaxis protein n=1 Tax=Rouxiella aceris TaxID=2703884 RepID=UPI002848DC52|nr:methyl-accepting chemotaxis protein [Rouxiella aceris]MDR3434401.1 methyl-accepting chemotaxis protein [Rouxiella aceris]
MILNELMLRNFSIGKKLFFGFFALIIITSAVSLYSIYSLRVIKDLASQTAMTNKVGNLLDAARRNRLVYLYSGDEQAIKANGEALEEIQSLVQQGDNLAWQRDAANYFIDLKERIINYKRLRDVFYTTSMHSNALAQLLSQDEGRSQLATLQTKLHDPALDSDAREKLLDISLNFFQLNEAGNTLRLQHSDAAFTNFQQNFQNVEKQYATSFPLLSDQGKALLSPVWEYFQKFNGRAKDYFSATLESQKAVELMGAGADALNKTMSELDKAQEDNNNATIMATILLISVLTVISIVIGVLAAWYITRQITRPINENLALAERITRGDLTSEITSDSNDELGRLTQTMGIMNGKLCEMISGIRNSVSQLAASSAQIAAGNVDLASRTEQQSAAVVETASSMEQLTSTVRLNAENALQASKLATGATHDARKGGEIISEVVLTMSGISESSNKITDIISVINGIAFQTNILALNAAVEAARAGEQGRGFAVVAGEVRTLAQRSATAAKEIASLINESVTRVARGTDLVNRAGEGMADIVNSVTHVSQIIDEISTSSNEQSHGIEQIGKAMTEMDSTTQQNATLVQESSASANSLEQQARKLSDMVDAFKIKTHNQNQSVHGQALLVDKKNNALLSRQEIKSSNADWTSF